MGQDYRSVWVFDGMFSYFFFFLSFLNLDSFEQFPSEQLEKDLLAEWENHEEDNESHARPYHKDSEMKYEEEEEEEEEDDERKHPSSGKPDTSSNSLKHSSEIQSKFKLFYSRKTMIHQVYTQMKDDDDSYFHFYI